MDIEFKTLEELYNRVIPALNTKRNETLTIYKIDLDIKSIFNYLAETKWKYAKDLVLSEIVSDILNVDIYKVEEYQNINKGII